MRFLHLVWSNLKRKKLRTSLTLLSIFVAFILFGLLCALKEAFTAASFSAIQGAVDPTSSGHPEKKRRSVSSSIAWRVCAPLSVVRSAPSEATRPP